MNAVAQTTAPIDPDYVRRLIASAKLDLSSEAAAQRDLETVLAPKFGPMMQRELHLSDRDRPDFVIDGGIVIECKMKGARKQAVYRQLRRYAEHPETRVLILVTNLAMTLPKDILGKPTILIPMGRAWL